MLFLLCPSQAGGAVTEKDEQRDRREQTPAAADVTMVLAVLAGRLDTVDGQLSEFHRRSAHRESIIDRLHEENQRFRGGIERAILDPVVADLIRLYDQLGQEARRLEAGGAGQRLLRSFADDVAEILDRCGYEVYSAALGDPFDRDRHRPLGVVPCADESRHNTVAEVVAAGFAERATGRVRRPLHARFYQYSPGPGAAQGRGAIPDQAHFQ